MLDNKVVAIIGGAGLLGKEFTKGVLSSGAKVLIGEYNLETCTEFIKELLETNSEESFHFVQVDITSKESLKNGIQKGIEKFGKIDSVVNTAYPRNNNYGNHLFDVDLIDFNENVNLNLGGYFLTTQVFAEYFKSIGSGNIINISSIYGVIPPKLEIYEGTSMTMPVEYAVIKSGLIHLSKYFAKYLKGQNVRVNCLSPGGIFDNQPIEFIENYNSNCLSKGMLNKEDMIGTLKFLLSDESMYINGQNIIIDDGFTL